MTITKSVKKSAVALGVAGLLSAIAFTMAIATPTNAEARTVCREGYRWDNVRCVEIRDRHDRWGRDHRPAYRVGGYLPRQVRYSYLPRDRWHRYQRVPVGYSYIVVGDEVLLLDKKRRIVRIYD